MYNLPYRYYHFVVVAYLVSYNWKSVHLLSCAFFLFRIFDYLSVHCVLVWSEEYDTEFILSFPSYVLCGWDTKSVEFICRKMANMYKSSCFASSLLLHKSAIGYCPFDLLHISAEAAAPGIFASFHFSKVVPFLMTFSGNAWFKVKKT